MGKELAPLAVSMGEPAGVGTECLLKAYHWITTQTASVTLPFFTIDDPARLALLARKLDAPFPVVTLEEPEGAADAFQEGLPVLPLDGDVFGGLMDVEPGKPTAKTAGAVTQSIRQAVELTLSEKTSGVVTLPIQKSVLKEAGFPHPGHTEFLGELTEKRPLEPGATRGPVMMLAAGAFRTVPVTIHIPLADVTRALTKDEIVRRGLVTAQALRRDFGISAPKIAITGLNPHAGEAGEMGSEEKTIITPAIEALQAHGVNAAGPFPADTLFHEEARRNYDAALAMYHDQALIPIKTAAFHEAVNITLGLPIIRTSPDHGTALAIAGKGVARPDSTIAAIVMASQMASARSKTHA